MQSLFYFLVKPVEGKRYVDRSSADGFRTVSTDEDHLASNREAEVIEVPKGYDGPIKKGDYIIVHHNVFKYYNDVQGDTQNGSSYFLPGIYKVEPYQIFARKTPGKNWEALDGFCFVSPIKMKNFSIFDVGDDLDEPLTGIMEMPDTFLKENGVKEGDKVGFAPDSEYEFNIDGKKMYRVFNHHITMSYGQ